MRYLILTEEQYNQLVLPEIDKMKLVRNNTTNTDLVVSTIAAFALFLSQSAKIGKDISIIAKDGVNGIGEWVQIIKMVPEIVPVLIQFYKNVIENAEEFAKQIKNMTPEQKEQSIKAFEQSFDITNDKAEIAIERSINLILEVITIINTLK